MKRTFSILLQAILLTVCAAVPSLYAAEVSGIDAADKLALTPTPQEITLNNKTPFLLQDCMIIALDDAPMMLNAANEINRRIQKLGGTPLKIASTIPAAGNIILLAPATSAGATTYAQTLNVTPESPGTQGYAIQHVENDGRTVIAVIGSDLEGAFYGAITLWHMIQKDADGQVGWTRGTVRDWPAFRRRCFGHLGEYAWFSNVKPGVSEDKLEKHIEGVLNEAEGKMRWLALRKINYAYIIGNRLASNEDPRMPVQDKILGAVCHRAEAAWNIKTRRTWGTELDHELAPGEWLGCVKRGAAKHCWTATAAHEKHAESLLARSKNLNLTNIVLHAVDGGRLYDPEWWSRRCDRCKEVYGNDHTRAAIEQFNFYYDRFKADIPKTEYEAVIWPYHFQWAVDGFAENYNSRTASLPHQGMIKGLEGAEHARKVVADLKEYHRALNAALPEDVLITFREGGPREFAAATALHGRHNLNIWIYWGRTEGMQSLFFPQARFAKTWYRPNRDDLIHTEKYRHFSLIRPAVSNEYAWNLNQPDAEPTFETAKRFYAVEGKNVTDYQKHSLIPRLCRSLWGDAGKEFEWVFANTISLRYIAMPVEATNKAFDAEAQDDPYAFMADQLAALRANMPRMEKVLDDMISGDLQGHYGSLRDEFGYGMALEMTGYAYFAWIKAEVEWTIEQARRAARQGKGDEAHAMLADLQAKLPEYQKKVEAMRAKLEPQTAFRVYGGSEKNVLWTFEPSAATATITELRAQIMSGDALGIPSHIQKFIQNRTVYVAPQNFKNPFEADGMRGEGRWHQAQPIEFFTKEAGARLCRYPTRAWMVFDTEALYVIAEMQEEPGVKPISSERERDGELWLDDAFEIMLDPSGQGTNLFQIILNSNGDRFDYAAKMGRKNWNPEYDYAVRTPYGMWAAEIRIPFNILGVTPPRPGDKWLVNIARKRLPKEGSPEEEYGRIIFSDNNLDVGSYFPLVFGDKPAPPMPAPDAAIKNMTRMDKTTEYGYATVLTFEPAIASFREAWDVKITIKVSAGDETLVKQEYDVRALSGMWELAAPLGMDLGKAVSGDLTIQITATDPERSIQLDKTFTVAPDGTLR